MKQIEVVADRPFAYNGMPTPFGNNAVVRMLCEGIAWLDTDEHGGVKLSPERNKSIPMHVRNPDGWYEEDVEWQVPFVVFRRELLATKEIDIAGLVTQAKKRW